MWRHVVVIADDIESGMQAVMDDGWRAAQHVCCDTLRWGSIAETGARATNADVLLAVPGQGADAVVRLIALLESPPPRPPVIAVLPSIPGDCLFETVALRADDFLVWRPDCLQELRHRILRMLACASHGTASRLTESLALARLVGRDVSFLATLQKIPVIARTEGTVLIVGETGTGKELCARAVHHLSPRRTMPFVPVDCGALPEQLVENELFGHVRGAFTDAHREHGGLVKMAEGGTLFLDEIDSLAQSAQAKILRLLEDRTFRPLGADRFVSADVRIVAATSADLAQLVHEKRFRSDLYFRLNVLPLRIPPLRERAGDVPLLARHFVDQVCAEARLPRKTLAPSALEKLVHHEWPGNVRELFNAVQHAVFLTEGPLILADQLPGSPGAAATNLAATSFSGAKARAIETFERSYIEALLRKHAGNITRCARDAKKDRRAFGRLVKKYNIDRIAG